MKARLVRAAPIVALALVALVSGPLASAQTQAPSNQSALNALAGPLYQQLAAIKGVTSPGAPPPIQVKSREETRRFIQQEIDRHYAPARLEAERKAMVAWGLIPPDYDLRRLFVHLI